MGHGITVECTNCDYIEIFQLGIGFMYSSLENVIDLISPKRKEKVLNILQNEEVHTVDYGHELFVCPKCNTLASRFEFLISYNNGKTYGPYFRCPECRLKLVLLKEPIENIPCPKCGDRTLTQFEAYMWD